MSVSNALSLLDEAISHMEQARVYALLWSQADEHTVTMRLLAVRFAYELSIAKAKISEALEETEHHLDTVSADE